MSTDSIGSGARNYATVADWWAGIPATLIENEIGEVYNDSELVVTATITLTGKTVGAFTITLRAAAGEGFADSKNDAGFKLQYDATQGAAISSSTIYIRPLLMMNNTALTVSGLQFKTSAGNSHGVEVRGVSTLRECLVDSINNAQGNPCIYISDAGSKAINCLAIQRGSVGNGIDVEYGTSAINCTAVHTGSAAAIGFKEGGGTTNIVQNCAAFNFTTDFTASGWDAASDYNASDSTNGPGANSVDSLTYADQFQSTTDDWRLKAGSGLLDTGNTDATNAPNDIVGNVRGVTLDGDIGAWEGDPLAVATLVLMGQALF